MSRDQRIRDNHALLAAQADALRKQVPLVVFFNLYTHSGSRSLEHFTFMLEGLEEVAENLQQQNIRWVMRSGNKAAATLHLLRELQAESVYFDFSPLKAARNTVKDVAAEFNGATYIVDTHNIIPAWIVSDKQEVAARTMRTKVHRLLATYLQEPPKLEKHPHRFTADIAGLGFPEAYQVVRRNIRACGIQPQMKSGEKAAQARLEEFLDETLMHYATRRNDIANDNQSQLSPYFHFGQISSLRVALQTMRTAQETPLLFEYAKMANHTGKHDKRDGMNALFEEMIVRKELSDNFCFYNPSYKTLEGAPDWAKQSLAKHAQDPREFIYSREEWETANTHDHAWNAAQNQLRRTGKIHGYMRMYWAKKILEWSATPEEAVTTAIYLNDKYMLDGGDPNGYVGVLWSIGGLHDRPWVERAVFGKVRYMNEAGLKRKYDLSHYLQQWGA
jgi:deoxyribodipyrimidine photo-lyase